MSFDEVPDYDPAVIEKYVISNMSFFRRWTLNNITLNQLNAIQIEQQMMPATPRASPVPARAGVSFSDVASDADTEKTETDTSSTVSCRFCQRCYPECENVIVSYHVKT